MRVSVWVCMRVMDSEGMEDDRVCGCEGDGVQLSVMNSEGDVVCGCEGD